MTVQDGQSTIRELVERYRVLDLVGYDGLLPRNTEESDEFIKEAVRETVAEATDRIVAALGGVVSAQEGAARDAQRWRAKDERRRQFYIDQQNAGRFFAKPHPD
ncbi:hypothetical protein ET495_14890 [Xylanimonas allomyrinae]|uniref:Uncharacterized protein n=1 Tax=Xylanimonas allomyrinae TaxID=2509459 RepID=A0A4P6F1S4_9MICO|nr:hypothetical protein [Xylanimonas allomyrinae]QAY64278.1 hypothetical protein ET495_14890 [Xylanimonas allomyrinae]